MIIGLLELSIRLPGVRSLKEKRHLIRGLLQKLRTELGVSIAEIGDHDLWGNASIGSAYVSSSATQAESMMRAVLARFDEHPDLEVDGFLVDVHRTG